MLGNKRLEWKNASEKTNCKFNNSFLSMNFKLFKEYKNAKMIYDMGGGFYGGYSTIITRIILEFDDIDNIIYEKNITYNNEVKDTLNNFKSGKMYIYQNKIYIESNGFIKGEDNIISFIKLGELVVDNLNNQ